MTKKQNNRKGKTYEELYGIEKAKAIKEKLIISGKKKVYSPEEKEKYKKVQERLRKGKTLEEIFGVDKAKIIKQKISERTKIALNKPKVKEKISAWQRGRIMPKEVIQKRIETIKRNGGFKQSDYQKKKASIAVKEARKYQIFPIKDTSIEVKIQNFLKELNIEFFTHQYIKEIEHGYQCDIFIPSKNLVIECDGDYWHNYPTGREIDNIRTKELLEKGFKVLRLWEFEINKLNLNMFKQKINKI